MVYKIFVFITIILIASCAPVKVSTQYDQSVNFKNYETWCWLQGCELVYEGPKYLYDTSFVVVIGNAIALEMQKKGFKQVDDNADLLMDFHILVEEDSSMVARIEREDVISWSNSREDYYHFLRGTLVIDIVDRRTSKVVWQSSTEKYMSLHPKMDQASTNESIKRALKDFPPTDSSDPVN